MKGLPGMKGLPQPRRVTVRLTPYQARSLWALRTAGLPDGAEPRTATEVIVNALLQVATLNGEPPGAETEEEMLPQMHSSVDPPPLPARVSEEASAQR
jgi:hypothetical protein